MANESTASGVHWTAILGGAFAMAAVSLILSPLGVALGVSASPSPWHTSGQATAITTAAIIWLVVTQWIASGVGGYLTGRLRSEWVDAHTHEVFFRDTVHGFLAWAVTAVIGAVILAIGASQMATVRQPEASTAATAGASLLVCLSLLIGAFIASTAGALGGRHRDLHYSTGSLRE